MAEKNSSDSKDLWKKVKYEGKPFEELTASERAEARWKLHEARVKAFDDSVKHLPEYKEPNTSGPTQRELFPKQWKCFPEDHQWKDSDFKPLDWGASSSRQGASGSSSTASSSTKSSYSSGGFGSQSYSQYGSSAYGASSYSSSGRAPGQSSWCESGSNSRRPNSGNTSQNYRSTRPRPTFADDDDDDDCRIQ